MVDILYWNIEQFGFRSLSDTQVCDTITSTIDEANPDLVFIVEVGAFGAGIGGITNRASGSIGYAKLRRMSLALGKTFNAVPPVGLAPRGKMCEAVGALWDNTSVTFLGPHVWSNKGPVPASQIGRTQTTATPPWGQLLGVGETFSNVKYPKPWNGKPLHKAGAFAPQVRFPNAANNGFITFPNDRNRRPARFEFAYGGTTYDIFVIHTSPNQAVLGTQALATIPDVSNHVPANTVRIILGDFNVNARNLHSYGTYGAFNPTAGNEHYIPQIGRAAAGGGGTGTIGSSINPPLPTMFKKIKPKWNDYKGTLSVDNVLVAPQNVAQPDVWIVNRVNPSPAQFTTALSSPYTKFAGYPTTTLGQNWANQTFRSWNQFGHIYHRVKQGRAAFGRVGASDHMPLLISI